MRRRGYHTHTPTAIQYGHQANEMGDADTQAGGTTLQYPPFIAMPPTTRYATPSSMMPPPTTTTRGADKGYPTTQRSTDRHAPHTTLHTQQDTAHDTTAVLTITAVGWAEHWPHHWTEQDGDAPPAIQQDTRRGWTPPCTVSPHTVHVHTTSEQQ